MCIRYFCFHLCLIFWCPFFLRVSESTCIISTDSTNILITYAPSHTKLALNYVLHEFAWQIKGRTFLVSWMRKWVKTLWRPAICKERQYLFSLRKWKTMQCALPCQSICILYTRSKRRAPKYSSVFQMETPLIKLAQMKKHWYKKIVYLKVHVSKRTETIPSWFSFCLGPSLRIQSCVALVIISSVCLSYFIYIFIRVHQRMPTLSKHFRFHLQTLL